MKRITVKDLKEILKDFSEDTIVCICSDSEANEMSTMLGYYQEEVGKEYKIHEYKYTGGQDVFGIDQEKDKGKKIIFLQPSL